MPQKIKISKYHSSRQKRALDLFLGILAIATLIPLSAIYIILVVVTDQKGSLFFYQERRGKQGKGFEIIKFRTMRVNSEKERFNKSLLKLNISDGPTFKIPNDPRYTKIGKFLAKSGLDELPQVLNVIKGEMSFVGPRPLPIFEANKLTEYQKQRELILPGITSSWVVSGSHRLRFNQWMSLDLNYVKDATLLTDLSITFSTLMLTLKVLFGRLMR